MRARLVFALAIVVPLGLACSAAPTHPGRGTDVEQLSVTGDVRADGSVRLRYEVTFVGAGGGSFHIEAPTLATFDEVSVDGNPRAVAGDALTIDVDARSSAIETTLRGATEKYADAARVVVPVWSPQDGRERRSLATLRVDGTLRWQAAGDVDDVAIDRSGLFSGTGEMTVAAGVARFDGSLSPAVPSDVALVVDAAAVASAPVIRDEPRRDYLVQRLGDRRVGQDGFDLLARRNRQRLIDGAYWGLVGLEVAVPVLVAGQRALRALRRRATVPEVAASTETAPPDGLAPAVVALLSADGHDIGDEAIAATILELARRGAVLIDARGGGNWHLVVRDAAASRDAMEAAVLDALATTPDVSGPPLPVARGPWVRNLRRAVVETARMERLVTRRYPSSVFITAVVALAITTAPLWLRSPAALVIGVAVAAAFVALPLLGGYVLTADGERAAAKWRAYGRYLDEHGDMGDVDPPGVIVWGEHLVFAAALGRARRAVDELRPGVAARRVGAVQAVVLAVAVVGAAVVISGPAGAQPACAVGSRTDFRNGRGAGRLVQANLQGADLSCQDLSGLRFGQARMSRANLHKAKLDGADFTQADLDGALLMEASGRGADFGQADLTGAHLDGADLTDADLVQTTLTDATLQSAKLTNARMGQAHLERADLRNASLRGADLTQATVDGAVLAGADLAGVAPADVMAADRRGTPFAPVVEGPAPDCGVGTRSSFRETVLDPEEHIRTVAGIDLACQDLSGLRFSGTDLTGARLDRTRLTGASLSGATLAGVSMVGADLSGSKLSSAKFAGLAMRDASFVGADLTFADFTNADIRGADFSQAVMLSTTLVRADARSARFERTDLTSSDATEADFSAASLRRAKLARVTSTRARFADADFAGASGVASMIGADLDEARNVPENPVKRWLLAIGGALVAVVLVSMVVRRSRGIAAET